MLQDSSARIIFKSQSYLNSSLTTPIEAKGHSYIVSPHRPRMTRPTNSSSNASPVHIPWLPKFDTVHILAHMLEMIYVVENETLRQLR